MPSTVAIIQARMGSSRLPGKVLEPIGPRTLIEHVYWRVYDAAGPTVVAIPDGDDALGEHLETGQMRVFYHDGPEADVLGRYAACARKWSADIIVRITADCPFVDPDQIRALLALQERTGADYCANVPNPQVDGLDVEVFTRELLERADLKASDPADREHVTAWMTRHAERPWYAYKRLPLPSAFQHRWTLDTAEDLAWLRRIAEHIDCTPPHPTTDELCRLLTERPELCHYATEPARAA